MLVDEKTPFRVVTIGESSVGKTCIINRYLRHKFDADERNTIGALYDSFTREYKGKTISIQLWDTAGQEQYRSLGPVYFRSATAALVVFSIVSRESFASLSEWIKAFRSVAGDNTVLIIVGNKCDLPDRVVQIQEAKEWAAANGCKYVETSAKTGQGINILFDELVASIATMHFEDSAQPFNSQLVQRRPGDRSGCC